VQGSAAGRRRVRAAWIAGLALAVIVAFVVVEREGAANNGHKRTLPPAARAVVARALAVEARAQLTVGFGAQVSLAKAVRAVEQTMAPPAARSFGRLIAHDVAVAGFGSLGAGWDRVRTWIGSSVVTASRGPTLSSVVDVEHAFHNVEMNVITRTDIPYLVELRRSGAHAWRIERLALQYPADGT